MSEPKKDNTFKINKFVDIKELIEQDKKNEVIDLLEEKKCKVRLIKIITASKYIMLIVGTTLIFVSSWLDNKETSKILGIIAGSINAVGLWFDKVYDTVKAKHKKIVNKIREKVESFRKVEENL